MSKKLLLTRRSFLRALIAGGLALTACGIPASGKLKPSQKNGETRMKKYTTNGALLPEAMTRGVDKDGWRIIGPGGGGAMYIPTIQPGNPETVLVSCDMTGAYLTHNGGKGWKQVNLKARPMAFAFDPSLPATVYAGATGLYRSTDSGDSWQMVFPDPSRVIQEKMVGDHAEHSYSSSDNWPGGSVQAICVDPQDSRRIFVGIRSDACGIFSSQDGGASWVDSGQVEGTRIVKSSLAKTPSGHALFILTDKAFYQFDLQGLSLARLPTPAAEVIDLSAGVDPQTGQSVLFLATPSRWAERFSSGLLRSLDLGQTWQPLEDGLDADSQPGQFRRLTCVAACPQDARVVYASALEPSPDAAGGEVFFGIFKSQDMGLTWQWSLKIGKTNPPNRETGWVERDYGTDWGGAPFYLSVCPSDPRVCYATDWGTTYRTVDGGTAWQQLYCDVHPDGAVATRGLDVTNIYWIHFDPFDREHLALACTDIGAFHSLDGGKTWTHALKGVPSEWVNGCYAILFDPDAQGRAWSAWSACHDLPRPKMFNSRQSHFQGGVCKSEDGLLTWAASNAGLPANCAATDIILDPRSPAGKRTLYLAAVGAGVFKSTDDGRSWRACNQGISGSLNAWRLVLLPDGRLYLLVCRGLRNGQVVDGALYTSKDGAASWQPVALPDGVNFPNDLAFDPSAPERLYLACWPTAVQGEERWGGLYRTEDGGKSWQNTFDASSHVYGVAVDPRSPSTLFITNFEGSICRSDDRGQTWWRLEGYNFKWAKQPILDPYNPGMLYVTTFGSSVWYGPAQGLPGAREDILSIPARAS